jgi:hypothetical protein
MSYMTLVLEEVMPWLRWLVAGLAPLNPGFDPGTSPIKICGGPSDSHW